MDKHLIDRIKIHEDWRAKPYLDQLGIPTIGYGFTYITLDEGDLILRNRVQMIYALLRNKISFFSELNHYVQEVLVEMAYQLGVPGLLKFKKTLKYLSAGENKKASAEMLDSKWAKQTPARAKELSNIVLHSN